MGEQWSPQTAPARQADIPTTPRVLPTGNTLSTMGIRIPKVPQEVPVANAIRHATTKIMAGRKLCSDPASARAFCTNTSEERRPVIFLREVAIVRIIIAGTIAIKPFGKQAIASLKERSLLKTKYATITINAMSPPQGRPMVASVFEKAVMKSAPLEYPT